MENGFSNHMIREKSNFNYLVHFDVNSVRYGNDAPCLTKAKTSIKIRDKIMCVNSYYIEWLNYNL